MEIELKYINDDWFRLNVDGTTVLDGHARGYLTRFEGIQEALKAYPDIKLAEIAVKHVYSCANCGAEFPDDTLIEDDVCPMCW
jgi:hypothetical protein